MPDLNHRLIHIYCGDGKGKTTAGIGLAVRAAGAGINIIYTQFLKNGTSSEIEILKNIENIEVLYSDENFGFSWNMTDEIKKKASEAYIKLFEKSVKEAEAKNAGLLIFDEIMALISQKFIEEEKVLDFLDNKPENLEVVLTGRGPSEELIKRADYVSEIKKIKHPFDHGINSRKGIEY